MKTVLNIIINTIIWMVIIFAFIITIASLTNKNSRIVNIGGYYFFSIKTESMEPAIKKGDIIIGKKYDQTDLNKGDIISFLTVENDRTIILTHRIEEVYSDGALVSYQTKGDNNEKPDNVHVTRGSILCTYANIRIPLLGYLFNFLKSKIAFFIFVIIPLFITFIYNFYSLIMEIIEKKKTKQSSV